MAEEYENYEAMARRAAEVIERADGTDPIGRYLASLSGPAERHETAEALRIAGRLIAGCGDAVPAIAWTDLRAPEITALARVLCERYPDSDVPRRSLLALRGLLSLAAEHGDVPADAWPSMQQALATAIGSE